MKQLRERKKMLILSQKELVLISTHISLHRILSQNGLNCQIFHPNKFKLQEQSKCCLLEILKEKSSPIPSLMDRKNITLGLKLQE